MGTGGRGSRLQPSLLNPDEASILLASQEPQALHKNLPWPLKDLSVDPREQYRQTIK
jgi:hypothetical protein